MGRNKLLALIQLVTGGIATLLVALAYWWFNAPIQRALVELDLMAGNAMSEIETVEALLGDIDGVAESIREAVPSHRNSLLAIGDSAKAVASTIEEWRSEIPGIQDISTDAAHICDTFAAQLPIRIPAVNLETKQVNFQLPEVIPKTQQVDIPYPTATVQTSTRSLSYPNGASVQTADFSRSLGSVAGRNLGRIGFQYPSGISVSTGSVALRYPSSIDIGTRNKKITIPDTPELNMKDYSFDIPDKLELVYRDLMKDEKLLLEKSSLQLTSLVEAMETTSDSMGEVKKLIDNQVMDSLDKTNLNLGTAEAALEKFRSERIPSVLSDLKQQREGLSESRGVFTALSGMIPLTFCVLALVCASIATSGGAKLVTVTAVQNQKLRT